MKKLTLIFTLLFTVLLSAPSYAEWTKVGTGAGSFNKGTNFYVDLERIKKHGGYVYFWYLSDFLKPDKDGYLSEKIYNQGDCKLFRIKRLSFSYHKEPMGEGTGDVNTLKQDWTYLPPNSAGEKILKSVCNHVK